MTFDRFVGEVQHRAQLGSLGEAVRAIRCTLGMLGQRLAGGEAKDLASQLPEEIGIHLLNSRGGNGIDFTAEEFLEKVCDCESVDAPKSVYHVRVVLQVMRDAISQGQFRHVLSQMPEDFKPLFEAGSEGKMRMVKKQKSARGSMGRRGGSVRGSREIESPMEEARPRSARITRRATGVWHLGR